jgi:uncharacterized Zn ribbon protein
MLGCTDVGGEAADGARAVVGEARVVLHDCWARTLVEEGDSVVLVNCLELGEDR